MTDSFSTVVKVSKKMLNGQALEDLDNIQDDIQENTDLMSEFETRFAEIGKMSTNFETLEFDEEELMKELDELDSESKDVTITSLEPSNEIMNNIQQNTYPPAIITNDLKPLDSSSLLDDTPRQRDDLTPLLSS